MGEEIEVISRGVPGTRSLMASSAVLVRPTVCNRIGACVKGNESPRLVIEG